MGKSAKPDDFQWGKRVEREGGGEVPNLVIVSVWSKRGQGKTKGVDQHAGERWERMPNLVISNEGRGLRERERGRGGRGA